MFQNKTPRVLPFAAASVLLLLAALALPTVLLVGKREIKRSVPYLQVDVSGEPGRLSASHSDADLNRVQ